MNWQKISIILPAYNEEPVIEKTTMILNDLIEEMVKDGLISVDSHILYVNDGSQDQTWALIQQLHEKFNRVQGIRFSRNFGHQNALIAGMEYVTGTDIDYAITIDADLQDDPHAIVEMVKQAQDGKNIVYGVRGDRTTDTAFKRWTAESFYKIMNWFGVQTIPNHADFRLIDQKVLAIFSEYTEREMFLRGIFPLIGMNEGQVFYSRAEREAGETKYPLSKMLQFAVSGITSFSVAPITFVRNTGIVMFIISCLATLYVFIGALLGHTSLGWPTIMLSVWALGGLQLVAIGIIGEYIGKIFMEVKHRPRYIVSEVIE
ncbi:glycosyltransferase family 2 protein [Weissella diestrammenae]|uniref:Glycosyltransferase family 2 protein n=1 Tax=Weissella diestrammenae TaxID=1162633 RepID=A0A7G9T518_9LACO|nr:glycosyltransferase family 2 protein [Weissella diestrammenae]MCM0582916.1 glycosyltransferase family 2 protein [Weissella diestrammenae]QNN75193.1 glycosyltransferase family 2 protein [Weissella diestrammenae]